VFTAADAAWSALRRIDRASSRIARDELKGRHVDSACIPDVHGAHDARREHVAPLYSMFITLSFIRAILHAIMYLV